MGFDLRLLDVHVRGAPKTRIEAIERDRLCDRYPVLDSVCLGIGGSAMSKRDTSRHTIEHDCQFCEENQTGIWALLEVLDRRQTDIVDESVQKEAIELCISRGSLAGVRIAA